MDTIRSLEDFSNHPGLQLGQYLSIYPKFIDYVIIHLFQNHESLNTLSMLYKQRL